MLASLQAELCGVCLSAGPVPRCVAGSMAVKAVDVGRRPEKLGAVLC